MTESGSRSRWWADRDEPDDAHDLGDPWPDADDSPALSPEQVRFLESLADQPSRSRVSDSLPGLGADETGAETGD